MSCWFFSWLVLVLTRLIHNGFMTFSLHVGSASLSLAQLSPSLFSLPFWLVEKYVCHSVSQIKVKRKLDKYKRLVLVSYFLTANFTPIVSCFCPVQPSYTPWSHTHYLWVGRPHTYWPGQLLRKIYRLNKKQCHHCKLALSEVGMGVD